MSSGSFDEVWSYPLDQIEEFLLQSGFEKREDIYHSDDVCVTLEIKPDHHAGPLALPRVRVRMEGSGAETFHHIFVLHFLSGGG